MNSIELSLPSKMSGDVVFGIRLHCLAYVIVWVL